MFYCKSPDAAINTVTSSNFLLSTLAEMRCKWWCFGGNQRIDFATYHLLYTAPPPRFHALDYSQIQPGLSPPIGPGPLPWRWFRLAVTSSKYLVFDVADEQFIKAMGVKHFLQME